MLLFSTGFLFACSNDRKGDNKNTHMNVNLSKEEALFKTHCITCHTLGYIDMQPDFPRKTWEKITEKMIRSYGAPIPDSAVTGIVNYLVSIKGSEE